MAQPSVNVLHLGKTPTRTVLKLAWPTILEQIAFTVLQFTDTAMVGALGAAYSAAVGISSPFFWMVNGLIGAASTGFSIQVAQAVGAGDHPKAQRVLQHSFVVCLGIGGLACAACFGFSFFFPALMGAQPEVLPMARDYMMVLSLSTLFNAFEMSSSSSLRCMGNTRAPMAANLVAIVLNIGVNYLLIFPTHTVTLGGGSFTVWGAGMGVAGAAWGTTVSIGVAGILVFLPLISKNNPLRLVLDRQLLQFERPVLDAALRLGVPVALERGITSLGQIFFLRIVSSLGTVAVAAHHIAVSAEGLSYLPAFGFSVSATTLVGQAVGANLPQESKRFGNISARLGLLCMTATGVILFVFSDGLMSLFTPDAAVIALGGQVLRVVAFAQPMQAFSIIYSGALRGAGNSRWPFYISLVGVWGIRLVLGCLFVFVLHLGLAGAWLAMLIDLCFRGVASWRRFARGGWMPMEKGAAQAPPVDV